MNYVEWTKGQNSIFAELDDLTPSGIVGTLGVGFLESFYVMSYGERKVPKTLQKKSTVEIAYILNGLFMKQWERLKEIFDTHLPIGFESETIIDEINIDVNTKEIDSSDKMKVAAFNTELQSDSNSSDSIINEVDNRERDKQYTKKNLELKSVDIQRKMIENENMAKAICLNISSVLGLSIY